MSAEVTNPKQAMRQAAEIAKLNAAGNPLAYLDTDRLAWRKAEEIIILPPKKRLVEINSLISSFSATGEQGRGTAGMSLTRLQAIGILDNLIYLTKVEDVMAPGYLVRYGSGSWGSGGEDVNHPAFSERAALQFVKYLCSESGNVEEDLHMVSIGKVPYVESAYTPPSFS